MTAQPQNREREVVVITGSSGLIGSAVVRALVPRFQVIGFDRAGDPVPPKEAECICVDISSDQSVKQGLERVRYGYGERIRSVIHLAAYYSFSGESSPKYDEITVRGTRRLLHELQGFVVGQFVFSSTVLVHAPSPPGERITEASPLDPKWAYPESKVKTERLIRDERGEVPAVLLRITGVYDDRCHSIPLAHQIQRIYESQLTSHFFPGDVTQGRQSFVHLDDLVRAFVKVVEREGTLDDEVTLLLGEPQAMSYRELQHEFGCLIHGEEWKTMRVPELVAEVGAWVQEKLPVGPDPFIRPWMVPLADDDYVVDIERARTTLDWEPERRLNETIPQMVAALEADPLAWYRENKLEAPSWLEEKIAGADSNDKAHHAPQTPGGDNENMSRIHGEGAHRPGGMPGMEEHSAGDMMKHPSSMSLWVNGILVLLGVWLVSSPATLGLVSAQMAWSDIASGTAIIVFAVLALSRDRGWAAWGSASVGVWLVFAPLVFWAPTSAGYANDTVVGALVIAFSILIPMGMEMGGPDVPRGWSYNPSTWLQRVPIIALGFIGLVGARYMAAYQMGHIPTVWEPFFSDGTIRVLESDVSRAWPVSDAGLGAATYMFEILMGLMGGRRRWRTMPWMVTLFGILVVPLGVTSIVLVILQPVSVGAWCTICLATALAMLIMVPLALDEVVAMGQFLLQSRREGKPFWRTFWFGGNLPDGAEDERAGDFDSPAGEMYRAMIRGVTLPPTLMVSAALGVWLMFAPSVLGATGYAADSSHVTGALVITVAVIALAEVARAARFVNVLLGAWIVMSPWVMSGGGMTSRWNGVAVGLALILLSLPRGRVLQRYGSWERLVR